jgi:hypothetical protein
MENCAIAPKCYNQIDFLCTFACNKQFVKWEVYGDHMRTRAPDLHMLWYILSIFVEYPHLGILGTEMAGNCQCRSRRANNCLLKKGVNGVNDRFCA